MRAGVVFMIFLLVLGGVMYFLLDRQGLLGADGISLLWSTPETTPPAREQVDTTPLAALLRDELAEVEQAKENLKREQAQFATETAELQRQRDLMMDELDAVRVYRETMTAQQGDNVQALSRMLSNMDAAAAADILDKLPEPLAVAVLLESKQRESGAMLEEMAPDKAAVLSERIAQASLPAS